MSKAACLLRCIILPRVSGIEYWAINVFFPPFISSVTKPNIPLFRNHKRRLMFFGLHKIRRPTFSGTIDDGEMVSQVYGGKGCT